MNQKDILSGYLVSGICCVILSFCLIKGFPIYNACKQWNTNKVYYSAGLYEDTAEAYEKLYPRLNDRIQYLFEYAQSLSKSKQYAESNRVLERAVRISCDPVLYNIMGKNYQAMKAYKKAEACFRKAAHIVPSRLYPWYLLAKLYDENGEKEKTVSTARIVLTKEPKVQSTAVNEMREEMNKLIRK